MSRSWARCSATASRARVSSRTWASASSRAACSRAGGRVALLLGVAACRRLLDERAYPHHRATAGDRVVVAPEAPVLSGLRPRVEHDVAQGPTGLEDPAEDVDQRLEPGAPRKSTRRSCPRCSSTGRPLMPAIAALSSTKRKSRSTTAIPSGASRTARSSAASRLSTSSGPGRARTRASDRSTPSGLPDGGRGAPGRRSTFCSPRVERGSPGAPGSHPRAHFPNNPWSRFRASSSACWRSFSASDWAFCSPCVVLGPGRARAAQRAGRGLADVGFTEQRADGARAGEPGDGERGRLHVEPGDLRSPRRAAEAERDGNGLGRRHLAAGERLHRRRGKAPRSRPARGPRRARRHRRA